VRGDEQEALEEVGVLLVGVLVDAGEVLDPGAGGDLDLDRAPLVQVVARLGELADDVELLLLAVDQLDVSSAPARFLAMRRASPMGRPNSGGAIRGSMSRFFSAMSGYPRS